MQYGYTDLKSKITHSFLSTRALTFCALLHLDLFQVLQIVLKNPFLEQSRLMPVVIQGAKCFEVG